MHSSHSHAVLPVVLSLLIAFAGCYTALGVVARARNERGSRTGWLLWAGTLFGCGVWAMHFTAMLALQLPFAVSYDWFLTAVSIVMACGFATGGLMLATLSRSHVRLPVAGALMGLGIAGMHYMGMEAMRMPARLQFAGWSVVAAALVATAAATAALLVARSTAGVVGNRLRHFGAALLGAAAVAALHYTAMLGTQFVPDPYLQVRPGELSPLLLMVTVVFATSLVLGWGLLTVTLDRGAELQWNLQDSLSQLQLRQAALRRSSRLAEIEIDAAGCIRHVTEAGRTLLGEAPFAIGTTFSAFLEPGDRPVFDALLARALAADFAEEVLELELAQPSGRISASAVTLRSGSELRLLLICHPVGERHRDADTGLVDRSAALAWSTKEESALAVRCSVEMLDGLSQLLDPPMLRQLLQALVNMLHASLADTEVQLFARVSTSDFLLVLGTRDERHNRQLMSRLVHTLRVPLWLGNTPWHISMRMGLAELAGEISGQQALRLATAALRRAEQDQVTLQVYQPFFDRERQEQLQLEQDLRAGLAEHQFRLLFQPKMELETGRLCGAEALLRWQHPTRGLLAPDTFIAVLESTGLIDPLGEWIIDESLHQWRCMTQATAARGFVMAINVSPLQLRQERFVGMLEERRRAYNVPASAIELEITEGIAMDRSDANLAILSKLRACGYRLAIDDFGTGYSSLAYLRELPIDVIKIDREFVRNVDSDPVAARMLGHMVAIGHTLGHTIVAEGVETERQLAVLKQLAVDKVQGYLIGRPMHASELMQALPTDRPQALV